MGGVASAVSDFVGDVVESVGSVAEDIGQTVATVVEPVVQAVNNAVEQTVEAVSDAGVGLDKAVGDTIPGGWVTVAAIAATVATAGAAGAGAAGSGGGFGISTAGTSTGFGLTAGTAGTGFGIAAPTLTSGLSVASGSALVGTGTAAFAAAESALMVSGAAESILAAEGLSVGLQTAATFGGYTAETAAAIAQTGANFVGPGVELIGGYEAAAAGAKELAIKEALSAAGSGALKGATTNALSSAIQGRDISPEGLLIGAATGAVGGGLGNVASNAAAEYGSLAAKTAGGLGGSLGGALTGAALTGGDLGEAALSGGIAGLTGGIGSGLTSGLNELGVDPVGSSLLAKTALGAGKAAVNGGDPLTGAFNAAAGAGLGMGLGTITNAAGNAIVNAGKDAYNTGSDYLKSLIAEDTPEQKLTQLASSDTMSDAYPSPLEEAIGKVTVTGAPNPTPEEKQYTQQLLEALYPDVAVEGIEGALQSEKEAEILPESFKNIDETGNIYDDVGEVVASAVELGLVKGTDAKGDDVWITPTGDFIPASSETQLSDFSTPIQTYNQAPTSSNETSIMDLFGTGESESASDFPENIINNPDGSVTIVENDGTQRIFNVDGSVTILDSEGKSSEEFGPTPKAEEAPAPENKPPAQSTLGNIAGSLLGTAAGMGMSGGSMGNYGGNTKIPNYIPGLAGLGAGIAAGISNANSGGQTVNPFSYNQYGFDFGQQNVNPVQNGVAQGQQFFNPTYTPIPPVQAAEGGLMNMPNTVQSTITENGLRLDPTSSVQMYAKGGNVDNETMSIVKHLRTGGAPMHHIAGFLDYRQKKMAQGGHLGGYSDGGRMLKGPGDGMSDDIPASIAGIQPARLANEEFVIPADVVSHLGNGSSEAGAKVLYSMMDKVRKARTGHTKQGKQINPEKLMPKARK
jgi:hypothetical protein